jgi:predicted molibdopterin-dependent oxidoreductase YjgC
LVDDALAGRLEALFVFGHDLSRLIKEKTFEELSRSLKLLVFLGSNDNATVARSHWVLPTAAYLEKDGTFVNSQGRIQRIGCAFPPRSGSREDWRVLLDLARHLGLQPTAKSPEEIFLAIEQTVTPFAGLSYESIGSQGVQLALP